MLFLFLSLFGNNMLFACNVLMDAMVFKLVILSLAVQEDDQVLEMDTATSTAQTQAKQLSPELEIYCYLIVLLFLIDQKKYNMVGFFMLRFLSTMPMDGCFYAEVAVIFFILGQRLFFGKHCSAEEPE